MPESRPPLVVRAEVMFNGQLCMAQEIANGDAWATDEAYREYVRGLVHRTLGDILVRQLDPEVKPYTFHGVAIEPDFVDQHTNSDMIGDTC